MWNSRRVLTWIQLFAVLATLCTRLRVVTGDCSGIDLARASPSVELATRESLVLRCAFEGACHRLHLIVVRMVVSLGVGPLLMWGAALAHIGGQLPRVLRSRLVHASR